MTERLAYDLLARTDGVTARGVGRLLREGHGVEDLAAHLALPSRPGSTMPFVTPSCSQYPVLLRELEDRPLRLFHVGRPLSSLSSHCVAVVGSRKASRYGLSWSHRLGAALAGQGITVCSGLAQGIDAAAHRGALEAANRCQGAAGVPVAVLGHGTDHVYPEQNRVLRKQMEAGGIVLSEYSPEHPPSRWTFPERNRIIAGICQTVVIVEAGPRSGSLHTARFANEAGRDVWVLPNRPGTPNSAGVLSLLRDGATPMFDIDEFVGQLVDELRVTHPVTPPPAIAPELLPLLLTLAQNESGKISDLSEDLGISAVNVGSGLAELEILGLVERSWDGTWSVRRWDLVEQQMQLCRETGWRHAA